MFRACCLERRAPNQHRGRSLQAGPYTKHQPLAKTVLLAKLLLYITLIDSSASPLQCFYLLSSSSRWWWVTAAGQTSLLQSPLSLHLLRQGQAAGQASLDGRGLLWAPGLELDMHVGREHQGSAAVWFLRLTSILLLLDCLPGGYGSVSTSSREAATHRPAGPLCWWRWKVCNWGIPCAALQMHTVTTLLP